MTRKGENMAWVASDPGARVKLGLMKMLIMLRQICSLLMMTLAVGCATGTSDANPECRFSSDCPSGQRCIGNVCIVVTGDGSVCPPGQILVDGACQVDENRCRENSDCPGGRCVDGECFANQCEDGDERPCDSMCGGNQVCRNGVWRPCPQAMAEICGDGRDNDCDGQTDEQCQGCATGSSRACETECGVGEEICAGDEWRFCTAPRVHPEVCGNSDDEDCDGTLDEGCQNCADGDERPCGSETCPGTETCVDRTWTNCTAQTPQDEICDGQDNDCDGALDEEIARSCDNRCGEGWEICKQGGWTMCTAPENCACGDGDPVDLQICGSCGLRQRNCEGGMWGDWSQCDEAMAQCQPGDSEDGACGTCGTHSRRCTNECRWGDWQPCSDEGVCTPGTTDEMAGNAMCPNLGRTCSMMCEWTVDCSQSGPTACPSPGMEETQPCGNCGVRRRTCSDCCGWSDWGECEEPADACEPGAEEGQACGPNCAVQRRTCNEQCEWGEFGECTPGGQCEPQQVDSEACGNCGTRTRACTGECVWQNWSDCGDQGACAPGELDQQACGNDLGQCIPGVEERTCDNQCEWSNFGQCADAVGPADEICGNALDEDCDGSDLEIPDQYDLNDRNDTCDTCTFLNQVRANGERVPDVDTSIEGTIDRVGDQDYYCVLANDGVDVPFFGENFDIELTNVPQGRDYDIYLYRSVQDCRVHNVLERSLNPSNQDESIHWDEAQPGNDNGIYVIKVFGVLTSQSCDQPYTLSVRGLN